MVQHLEEMLFETFPLVGADATRFKVILLIAVFDVTSAICKTVFLIGDSFYISILIKI